jgi:hypothetical protein
LTCHAKLVIMKQTTVDHVPFRESESRNTKE